MLGQINIYIVSISTNRSLDLKLDMSKFASDYMQDLLSKASRDYDRNYIWSEIMKGPASIKDALKLSNEKIVMESIPIFFNFLSFLLLHRILSLPLVLYLIYQFLIQVKRYV